MTILRASGIAGYDQTLAAYGYDGNDYLEYLWHENHPSLQQEGSWDYIEVPQGEFMTHAMLLRLTQTPLERFGGPNGMLVAGEERTRHFLRTDFNDSPTIRYTAPSLLTRDTLPPEARGLIDLLARSALQVGGLLHLADPTRSESQ